MVEKHCKIIMLWLKLKDKGSHIHGSWNKLVNKVNSLGTKCWVIKVDKYDLNSNINKQLGWFLLKMVVLGHYFQSIVSTKPRIILRNWERFVFMKYPYTIFYLSFHTGMMVWENRSHLQRANFQIFKGLF